MGRRKTRGICVYCGRPATTKDHVPPKGFIRVDRTNLVTVRACENCNGGASADDAYAQLILSSGWYAANHPEAEIVSASALASLGDDKAVGFREALIRATTELNEITTPAGLYLGPAAQIKVDRRRIFNVVERTLRGLHWRQYRMTPVPRARTVFDVAMIRTLSHEQQANFKAVLGPMIARPGESRGKDNAVRWWSLEPPDVPAGDHLSLWGIRFYGAFDFFATFREGTSVPVGLGYRQGEDAA